jgi:hypothetical protein
MTFEFFLDVVFRLLLAAALARALIHAEIFEAGFLLPIRPWLMSRQGMIGLHLNVLFSCAYCLSFWCGMLAWNARFRNPLTVDNLLFTLCFAFVSSLVGAYIDTVFSLRRFQLAKIETQLTLSSVQADQKTEG